jgi:hypothetical protein
MKITIKKGDITAPVTVQMLDENGQLQEANGKLHWKRLSQREVGELIASEHAAAVNADGKSIFDQDITDARWATHGHSGQAELAIGLAIHARIFAKLIAGWDFEVEPGTPLPCTEEAIVSAITGPEGPRLVAGFYPSLSLAYGVDPRGNVIDAVPEESAKN